MSLCCLVICVHSSSGFRRASDDPEEFDEEQAGEMAAMTEEQKEYLRWYYRTEDCK